MTEANHSHTWDQIIEVVLAFSGGELKAKALRALLAEPITPTNEQIATMDSVYHFTIACDLSGRLLTYHQGVGVMFTIAGKSDVIVHHGEGAEQRKRYILDQLRVAASNLIADGRLPASPTVEEIIGKVKVRETLPADVA